MNLQIVNKVFFRGENHYIDSVEWRLGLANDIVLKDGAYILIDIHHRIPEGLKVLNVIRGRVISDYQEYLDADWIASLRKKYSIDIDFKILYSLIK